MNPASPVIPSPHFQWDAGGYAIHSRVQQEWARELIASLGLKGNEHVLDVGCGDGKISAELARSVSQGAVTGMDASPEMIAYARAGFPVGQNPNLNFQSGDARQIELVVPLEARFDLVFSNAALHWVDDHPAFLRGASARLRPGGRLVVSCGGRGNAREVFRAMVPVMRRSRWRPHFRAMPRPYFFYAPEDYAVWLPAAGFCPHRVELAPKDVDYASAADFATWLRVTWLPYVQRVPSGEREEFIAAVTDQYLVHHPPEPDGSVRVRMVRLEIVAEKITPAVGNV